MKNRVKIVNLLCYYILPIIFFAIYFITLAIDAKQAYRFSLEMGVWAWRLLVLTMFIGPLGKILPKIRIITKWTLRKQYGVLITYMFIIHFIGATLHKELFSLSDYSGFDNYLLYGLLAGIIMLILGITSNVYSMKKLNKVFKNGWKKVHKLAYLLFILVVIHSYLISYDLQYLIILGLYILIKVLEFSGFKVGGKK